MTHRPQKAETFLFDIHARPYYYNYRYYNFFVRSFRRFTSLYETSAPQLRSGGGGFRVRVHAFIPKVQKLFLPSPLNPSGRRHPPAITPYRFVRSQ